MRAKSNRRIDERPSGIVACLSPRRCERCRDPYDVYNYEGSGLTWAEAVEKAKADHTKECGREYSKVRHREVFA